MSLMITVLAPCEMTQWLIAEWTALADEVGRPQSAPAWVLAWCSFVMTGGNLRVIAVRDESSLLGVFPLVDEGSRLTRAGGDLFTAEPLARPGHEAAVAAAFGEAMAGLGARSSAIEIEYEDGSPDWQRLLAQGWPNRKEPRIGGRRTTPVMRLDLGGHDFDSWFASKSSNFRRDVSRKGRRLEREGACLRSADRGSLAADLAAFLRLHRARHPRGTSLNAPGVERMLLEIGERELESGRFRLFSLDVEGEPEAALLLAAGGTEVCAWASGQSERLARHSPTMQCFIQALREMSERGEQRLNLGPGDQDYKLRLASEEGRLESVTMVPAGSGSLRARLGIALRRSRGGAAGGLQRWGTAAKRLVGGGSTRP